MENFYHPYKVLFSDDVKRFHLKEVADDKYIFLFIKNSILRQKCKYEFGYKFNAEHMGIQKIVLPIDADGRPDYSFMRDYMRWVEWRMLAVYGKYLGIRIANIVKGPSSPAT